MKTVRFSKVVDECGSPEVFLLLREDDPDFQKALKANRIMTLTGRDHNGGTDSGSVGYDPQSRGQLLEFPKSLRTFADRKVVGIKYDLLQKEADEPEESPKPRASRPKASHSTGVQSPSAKLRSKTPRNTQASPQSKTAPEHQRRVEPPAAREVDTARSKVLKFPGLVRKRTANEGSPPEAPAVSAMKGYARQALRALEKNNSVAAYNLLKKIVGQ